MEAMVRGWIEKRTNKNGSVSYRIRYALGTGPKGTRKQPSQTFATRKEAEKALAIQIKEVHQGTAVCEDRQLFGDYLQTWLSTGCKKPRPPTKRRYTDLI